VKLSKIINGELYIIKLDPGERLPDSLIKLAEDLKAGFLTFYGLGGFKWAKIGFFKEPQGYDIIEIFAPSGSAIEVTSITGSVLWTGKKYHAHIHVTLGTIDSSKRTPTTYAGHLIEAEVNPLIELFLTASSRIDINILKETLPHRFQ